jgi:hypothetical protein
MSDNFNTINLTMRSMVVVVIVVVIIIIIIINFSKVHFKKNLGKEWMLLLVCYNQL